MAADTMNPVVHFEMPAEDRHRMRQFYETTFGWKTEQLGPDMGDYVLVTYVSFFDTEGNRVSMMQPDQMWTREGKSR